MSFLQSVNDGSIEKEKCDDRKYIEEEEAGDGIARHYRHPNSKYYRLKYTNTILKTKNIQIFNVCNLGVGKVTGIINYGLTCIITKEKCLARMFQDASTTSQKRRKIFRLKSSKIIPSLAARKGLENPHPTSVIKILDPPLPQFKFSDPLN